MYVPINNNYYYYFNFLIWINQMFSQQNKNIRCTSIVSHTKFHLFSNSYSNASIFLIEKRRNILQSFFFKS
jgi:hypothetical protein